MTPPPSHPQGDEWLRKILVKLDTGGYLDEDGVDGALRDVEAELRKREAANNAHIKSVVLEHSCGAIGCYNDFTDEDWQRFFAQLQQPKQEQEE